MRIKLDNFALAPYRAHMTDAGMDLKSPIACTIPEGGSVFVDTGVHVQLPQNTYGHVVPRSSMFKRGLFVEGTIDEPYTGSIKLVLWNIGNEAIEIDRGDRIAQMIVIPCVYPKLVYVDELDETERGDGGFGSTGK